MKYYLVLNKRSHQVIIRHGRFLNAYLKAAYCFIPPLWHLKKAQLQRLCRKISGCQEINRWSTGFSGQWIYTVWCVSLYMCPNPQNVHHQEWTSHKVRTWVMMQQCSFSTVAEPHPGTWRLTVAGMWAPFVLCAQIFCEPKTLLKHKLYIVQR